MDIQEHTKDPVKDCHFLQSFAPQFNHFQEFGHVRSRVRDAVVSHIQLGDVCAVYFKDSKGRIWLVLVLSHDIESLDCPGHIAC
jgi:hypothetical protein